MCEQPENIFGQKAGFCHLTTMEKPKIFAAIFIFLGSFYVLDLPSISKLQINPESPRFKRTTKTEKQEENLKMTKIHLITRDEIPVSNQNIFFIETNESVTSFSGRLLCAFESCATQNPDRNVNVIVRDLAEKAVFPKYFERFKNVKFSRVDFEEVADGTPVGHLFKSGSVWRSEYSLHHASDLMRLVLLYNYGGSYMDTDIIFIAKVPPVSFVAPQTRNDFSNGVLGFTKGHQFLNECLTDVGMSYDPWSWSSNGAIVVTRKIKQYCRDPNTDSQKRTDLKGWICPDLDILPIRAYYPLAFQHWRKYFDPNVKDLGVFKSTIGLHYWNAMRTTRAQTGNNRINISTDHPLFKIMKKYCPMTFKYVMLPNIGKEYRR